VISEKYAIKIYNFKYTLLDTMTTLKQTCSNIYHVVLWQISISILLR